MAAGKEVELKLELDEVSVAQLAAVDGFSSSAVVRRQRSIYLDDAARSLLKAGLSLRIRHADGRRVQTMKADAGTSAGLFSRAEVERAIEQDVPDLGEEESVLLRAAGLPVPESLRPVFESEVSRSLWTLDRGEARVEAVFDDGMVAAADRKVAVRELELELKQGAQSDLFVVARAIIDGTGARLGVRTKAERGYQLLEPGLPGAVKASAVALRRSMTAREAFQAIVRACLRHFRLNEDLLLATGAPQPLHQARVALRRLRSAFSIFKPMLQDARVEHLRGELRWLAAGLGEVRNFDVLIPRAADEALAAELRDARGRAYTSLADSLASPRARRLMLDLVEWVEMGAWLEAPEGAALREQKVRRFAREALDKLRRQLKRRGANMAALDDESRHEARIVGKKLRYAAEFFSDLFDEKKALRRRKRFVGALERLQSALGDLNDLATGEQMLGNRGVAPDRASAAFGRSEDRERLLREAEDAYEELLAIDRFWR